MAMDRIYQDSDDVYVSNNVIYTDGTYAYADQAKTTKVKTSELLNAFLKGCVIYLAAGEYAVPIGYKASGTPLVGTVSYIVPNSTTATSADIATISGVADPA